MANRKAPPVPFPNKPLPLPTTSPIVSDVEAPMPLQLNDQKRRTLKRHISQKEAFSKVGIDTSNSDGWWNDDTDTGAEYFEYTNAAGEVIEPEGSIAIALWDFNGERDTDLPFKKGDAITVIQRYDNGWWEGELNGYIGDFPCNFVEIEEPETYETETNNEPEMYEEPVSQPVKSFNPPIIMPHPQSQPVVETKPRSQTSAPPPLPPKPKIQTFATTENLNLAESGTRATFSQKGRPIKEGFLTKKGHKRRNWKVRYFVLTDSSLAYYKGPNDYLAKRKPKGEIALLRSTMVRVAPEMKRSNCFTVSGGLGLLYITAPTGEEMVSWMEKIASVKP